MSSFLIRRKVMNYCTKSFAFLFVVLLSVAGCGTDESRSVTAVSWGGSYGRAINEGVNIPFAEESGIGVVVEDYNGGLAQIRAQVEIGEIHWDLVDLEIAHAVRGCDEGLLERLDINQLPPSPDGIPAAEDFLAGTFTDCGMGTFFWSMVYAYNEENILSETKPSTMADFFDLNTFPGRRGMRRVPQMNIEFALIADGVPLDQVYATMSTPDGLDRAFAKLDMIKEDVIWWEAGAQPPQMLADGEVIMSTAYNGRIFNAQVLEDQPFVIVWHGQLLSIGQMVIVAGTPRLDEALEYLKFASTPEAMSRVSNRISYSPARRSGASLVATHVTTGIEMEPHMPASPANAAHAVHYDWSWWADHQDELNERFSAWLAQ